MIRLVCLAILLTADAAAAAGDRIHAATFSESTAFPPVGWKASVFKKIPPTVYELTDNDGIAVISAKSNKSASGLGRHIRVDPARHPIIRWRWKITKTLAGAQAGTKKGDDYPARVYVTFEYDPKKVSMGKKIKYKAATALRGELPIAALSYIWASKLPKNEMVDSAYAKGFIKIIAAESGSELVGKWQETTRNVYEDYKRAFGHEPPMINGIAIMTDTDNTKDSVQAFYGDIWFEGRPLDSSRENRSE